MDSNLATKLPENILFGTSSWTYEGWRGNIYQREYKNEKAFRAESLSEYVTHPWFRTVGIDSSFYGPPHPKTLERYASQVPSGFSWMAKAWEEVTIPQYAKHKRYGSKAGLPNPHFLNADYFCEGFLSRFDPVKEFCGPFVFQFQTLGRAEIDLFFEKLEPFLAALPTNYLYATEVRNTDLLRPEYFDILNRHGITHCFNHWTRMPRLLDQMKAAARSGGLQAPFYLARILTPRGVSYAEAVKRFSPYCQLQSPIPEMRADLIRLAKRAHELNRKAYIIVNNRSEGHAPTTIAEVGSEIVEHMSP